MQRVSAAREAKDVTAAVPERRSLRIVTYNIHKCIGGLDRLYRPERIIKVLRRCDADLVFLQEVDEGAPRSSHDRQVDLLGDALGYPHRAYFPNVRLRQGHYGNAMLCRFPLDHQENIDLTRPLRKRRGALHTRLTVEVAGRSLRLWIYNVHLGLGETERRQQLRHLMGWHASRRPAHDTAVLIGGDLNDVYGQLGRVILTSHGFRSGQGRRHLTFPAARPLRPLDAFFARGPIEIARSIPVRGDGAREASDHLPLLAVLRPM